MSDSKVYTFVNTTPHRVTDHRSQVHFEPDNDHQIRVKTQRVLYQNVELSTYTDMGISLYQKTFGELSYVPPVKNGILYIVSLPVKQACPDRTDFVSPSDLVRNEKGEIIACDGFDV